MNIPLDRLYHYIENIAKEIRGDDVLIYHFYPHGSKKIENLIQLYLSERRKNDPTRVWVDNTSKLDIYCHDQEPLCFFLYGSTDNYPQQLQDYWVSTKLSLLLPYNLRILPLNIHDRCLLIHSEKRSSEVEKYQQNQFITVYYWSHAIISRDWFRFAQHDQCLESTLTKPRKFLIYNRAWSGTREYRLKFLDLLIESDLVKDCQISCSFIEPETSIYYKDHNFLNLSMAPTNHLENHYIKNIYCSSSSADYNTLDYLSTDFEVVLETLFDDDRLHLTEKALRPIACGQPFILAATHGSLEYLRSYGFKTFDPVINESYDKIKDPVQRLQSITNTMKDIMSWDSATYTKKMKKIKKIAEYNRRHFFSNTFSNQVINELKENLKSALETEQKTNTGSWYFELRKYLSKNDYIRQRLTTSNEDRNRQDIAKVVLLAKQSQLKNL
jgi:hypothetical protein